MKRKGFVFIVSIVFIVFFILPACKSKSKNDYMLLAVLYKQRAAEVEALYYQAYNAAKLSLENQLRTYRGRKKPAVVVDIDETVLDNSPYQVMLIKKNTDYSSRTWKQWCDLAKARALPGAIEFLKYAVSRGVDVFYVSNRKVNTIKPTIKNLKAHGFPQVKREHIYLRTTTSSKIKRRKKIKETHEILILCGDALTDFTGLFEHETLLQRSLIVKKYKKEFGKKWIILPNPMYGDWDSAVYKYKKNLTVAQKKKLIKKVLNAY